MRSIQVEKVRDAVRDMCIEANYSLSPDMRCVFEKACQEEKSPLGRQILNQLSENLEIAKRMRSRSVRIPEWLSFSGSGTGGSF